MKKDDRITGENETASMKNKYQMLAGNTVKLGLGTFGSKLLVFLMVRFYTEFLSPADYGTADLITQTAQPILLRRRHSGRWCAQITFRGKTRYLGSFENKADAVAARRNAEQMFDVFLAQYYAAQNCTT